MADISIYELILLQRYFGDKKEPTEREKAAAAKLGGELLAIAESMQRLGPIPNG